MIKLIIFDLDHTTLNDSKQLSPRFLNLVTQLQNKGIKTTFASGRAYELVKPYALKANIDAPLILNNGALIKTVNNREPLVKKTLSEQAKTDIIKEVLAQNLPFAFYCETAFVTNDEERTNFYQIWNETYPDSFITIVQSTDYAFLKHLDPYKLLIIDQNKQTFNSRYFRLKKRKDAHVTKSQDHFLDILPLNTNKGEGVKWLKDYYGYHKDEVLAFGDNDNDIEMFKQVGYSVAMPNGSLAAKAAAKVIAPADSNHDGVSQVLEYLLTEKQFD